MLRTVCLGSDGLIGVFRLRRRRSVVVGHVGADRKYVVGRRLLASRSVEKLLLIIQPAIKKR